jgi:hypothetical protein
VTAVMITANGRYAVALYRDGKVTAAYLFDDEQAARRAALGWDGCRVIDLKPCPLPKNCKSVGYSDRDERRRYGND